MASEFCLARCLTAAYDHESEMRKVAIGCLGTILVIVIAIPIVVTSIQLHAIEKTCRGKTSKIESADDAIGVVRAYRGEWPFDGNLNGLRQSKEFQSDNYGANGGWRVSRGWLVSEWPEWIPARVFDVAFELEKPDVVLECHVLACGAVADCRSFGEFKD
jgi:hypothetical protein